MRQARLPLAALLLDCLWLHFRSPAAASDEPCSQQSVGGAMKGVDGGALCSNGAVSLGQKFFEQASGGAAGRRWCGWAERGEIFVGGPQKYLITVQRLGV